MFGDGQVIANFANNTFVSVLTPIHPNNSEDIFFYNTVKHTTCMLVYVF